MPETERKLVLHSPASSEHVEYRWPLSRTETWDEAVEIVETIRWVCRDFPDLKLAVEKFILNSFEPTSFESMKQLCERYNRAVANIKKLWSGRQPPPGIDAPPSIPLLRHIINQVYNRAVTNPEDLNSYEPFSPEVYGETSFELVCEVMKHTKMTENDVFVDLGSGIGQVVLQVAAKIGCKCYGMEKADIPAKFAERMEEEFVRWMDWYGKSYGEFELMKGDFLDPEFIDDILQSATVIFTNNFAFGPKLNHELKLKFANLKDGTKVVSSHEFCPLNFRITTRNLSDIGSIMHVAELSPLKGSVSWTGKQVSYYLHTIDRGKLEKFYLRQKHPDEYKSESSSHSGTSSEDSSDSSCESDDDQFKSALRRIKLEHYTRSGSKKARDYHQQSNLTDSKLGHHKRSKGLLSEPAKPDEQRKKRRWQLKSALPKDSNSSAMSSSAVSSPGLVDIDGLFSSFHNQLEAYMSQLGTPYFQQWIVDAIEKEKMKKSHLQGVINHLESEVAGLSKETVDQMKENMKELGIQKMTPDGLLLGAKSIVSQNKQLRKEMTDLEREITTLIEQNKAMEAMCVHHKADPKLLPKLPLFGPEGEVMTNGISSPCHLTPSYDGEQSEQMQVTLTELKEAKSLSVDEVVILSTVDSKHMCLGLVKEYQIELERIDQQLLELGPYAQDAYDDDEPQLETVQLFVSPPPPEVRRGKKGKPPAPHKASRRPPKGVDDFQDTQRGGWRALGGGWTEVSDRKSDDKDLPKKKWRKVGSAGPTMRGKEGQLDAQSDPLNVSSANIIVTPLSDLERRAFYQSPQESKRKSTPGDGDGGESMSTVHVAQMLDHQGIQTGDGACGHPNDFSISTTAHSTPSCNTTSPLDSHGHFRTQPTAQWKPISGGQDLPHPLQEGYAHHTPSYAHLPQQVQMDTSGTSEEVDVTRVEGEESPKLQLAAAAEARQSEGQTLDSHSGYENHLPPQARRDSHGPKPGHQLGTFIGQSDSQQTHSPSPKTTIPGYRPAETVVNSYSLSQHQPPTGGIPKPPGFSISHLTEFSAQSPVHDAHSYMDSTRGPSNSGLPGECSVVSPHGEVGLRKRRSSSSSSYRSTRQQSVDDTAAARSGSPLSACHPRGQYMPGIIWDGGTVIPSPNTKDKVMSSDGKVPGMIPFSMWPPGMPIPTEGGIPGQVQRYPLSSPFLAASHPWLRGGMISGLPFRPALYPTGAAASIDPSNPYKSMLGLPLYPFPPTGLKGPFPTPAFTSPSSAPNSQPQTPSSISSTPGFPFGQYPMTQGMGANALREAQSRLPGGSPQLVQHPSFAVGKDSKQRGSPETNQDMPQQQPWSMIPGMSMLQAPFGFGVQNPLSSSVSQAPPLNFLPPRGPIPFSTSPLTLATQSIVAGASGSDIQHSAMEAYHQAALAGRWSKKQSSSSIDLTREQVVKHIEAPSPQEAVKMATQRISPFQDTSRFSPKLKSVQEAAATPPSSSSLVPSTQAQGPVLSYPMLSAPGGVGNGAIGMPGHIINPSQLMGVALSGSHMIPMNYQAIQNLSGKVEDGVGKKRSPKRGGGTQKLRIHQMDFKNQGKVDRRRRRPWKLQEKPQEESNVVVSTKPAESTQSRVVSTEEPSSSVQAPSEDNYALNMLADCSSKEGEKTKPVQVTAAPQQTQELTAKRTLMRSPGSIAGANSLLLLAKPDTVSSAGSTGQRASPPENAVVDSLLELSKPSISSSSAAQDPSESRPASESGTQSTAAEAILMIGHGGLDSKGDTKEGKKSPISEKVNEGKEKGDVDSEKTDTDSEATLSPTSPALTSTATCRWPQGAPKTQAGEEKVQSSTSQELTQEFVKPTVAPARRALDVVQTILKNGESPSQASNYSEAPSLSSPVATTSEETPRETTPPAYPAVKTSAIPSPPAEQVSPALESVLNGVGENIAEKPPPPSDQEKNEAVVVTSEMQLLTEAKEKRELLDFGPPSSRLEMIDDEEDADVDVENIDSSLLDEPDPVINSPQSSKSPVLTSPSNALETQPSVLPEVVPSPPPQGSASPIMPSPHPQLQDLADSPCKEPVKEDTVNRVEEKMQHEEEPLVQTIEDSEPQPDTDAPLPKRPRVEESEEQVGKMESEENQLDEVMDTETPRSPAVGNTSSPSPKIITPVSPSSRVAMTDITPEPCPSPLPSAADVKESEEATKSVKDEVKLTTAENVESSNSRSRSGLGNSPVEPLSPANFTDKQAAVTSETDDKEVPLFEGAVSQDAEVAGEPVQLLGTTAPTQEEKSSEETNHDAAVSDAADGPSACILWPAEPDEQVPAEMNASSVQKSITPTSPASPSTNYSDDCKQPNAPTKTHSRSPSPVAGENIAAASMQTSQKNPNHVQESRCPQLSPEAYQVEKTTKSMKTESNVDPLQAPSRISPPVAPQNRLPVGKSGFDRHQQHRKLMSQQHAHKQHSRDEKNLQSKKWPRMQDPGSRARGLFDVDPQESRRQKTDNRTSEREPVKHPSEGRKVKPRLLPPTHGHSNKQSTERAKYNNRPPRSSEDQPHRHSRPQDGSQGSTWEQGKQKVRPPGRQGPRFSPLPPHLTEHSPGHPKDHDEVPCISDEEQTRGGRVRVGHQNSHGWREGHQPPTDHTRDRGYVLNKLKGGHRTDSKQGFEQGRKIVRIEKEKDQRKHMSTVEANTDERAPVFKRHREEDTDHTSSARLKLSGTRKRSYESVSEDELPEDSNRSSSRESSLVAEDRTRSERRSSLEAAEQRSSAWRKEQKITPDGSDDTEEFSRISKHKKHKHGSKERKERRKWRKTTDGNDQKLKRSSEDKMWLSYHKH